MQTIKQMRALSSNRYKPDVSEEVLTRIALFKKAVEEIKHSGLKIWHTDINTNPMKVFVEWEKRPCRNLNGESIGVVGDAKGKNVIMQARFMGILIIWSRPL